MSHSPSDELEKRIEQRFADQEKAVLGLQIMADRIWEERDHRYQQRFDAQEKAISLAFSEFKDRLAGVNEFRGQLKDQQATFISRTEMDAKLESVHSKLDGALKRIDLADGRSGGFSQSWAIATVLAVVAISLVSLFLKFG